MSIENVSKQISDRIAVHGPTVGEEYEPIDAPPKYSDDVNIVMDAIDGYRGEDQQLIAEEGIAWIATMLRKNRDYGGSVWRQPVLAPDCKPGTAIRVRMSDKIARIQSLLEKDGAEVSDESLEDSIRDLGAYCLLLLVGNKRKDSPCSTQSDS